MTGRRATPARIGKISYRRAGVNDVEALISYRVRFLNEYRKTSNVEQTKLLKNSLREYFLKAIPTNEFISWIAERDGEIVGTSGMVIWRLPARYGGLETGRAGYILNLYTVPKARGIGICTQLLEKLIGEARSTQLRYLHLHASKEGIRIYRKRGFVEPEDPELKLILE